MPSVFCCLQRQNDQRLWQPANQESISESFGETQSQLSGWLKKRKTILQDAASSHRKLYLKGTQSTKYLELYKALFKKFLAARSRGHRLQPESSNWTLTWKSKLNIMIMCASCSKKNWEWGQNKEAKESTRKKWNHHWRNGMQRSEESTFGQDWKTLVMIRNGEATKG